MGRNVDFKEFTHFKFVITALVLVMLNGCGSSSKKSEEASDKTKNQDTKYSGNYSNDDQNYKKNHDLDGDAKQSSDGSDNAIYGQLNKAIQSNNEEKIYHSAIEILSVNPNDVKALNSLGMYHYKKGHYKAAEYFFKKANKINGQSTEVLNNLGIIALTLGERKEAIGYFRKALSVDPQNVTAAANIGSIYTEDKDYTKAQVALEIAYKKLSRDFRIMNNYAVVLSANGKYEKAKEIYRELLRGNDTQKEVLFNYAILLIDHLKQYSEGLDIINKLKFHGVSADMKNKLASLETAAKSGSK